MYDNHNPAIAAGMREDPETFIRGALFAIVSIRQPIVYVPDLLADVYREGRDCVALFGFKRDAYDYLQEHGTRLWLTVRSARDAREAVGAILAAPGLGVVKAAFVAQLCGFDVACLDSRNMKRLGLPLRAWRSDGEKVKHGRAFARKVDRYLALTEGRAREFWDDWCTDVAGYWGKTPHEISELHLAIIN